MIDLFANLFMGLWISSEKKVEIINFKIEKLKEKPTTKNSKKIRKLKEKLEKYH